MAECDDVLRTLKVWCLAARDYDRQWQHLAHPLSPCDLSDNELEALLITFERPSRDSVKTDVELDAAAATVRAAAAPATTAVPKSKAAARGARGGSGRTARGRARGQRGASRATPPASSSALGP
eukprot:14842023-Alexandrium_andersonii.AAC.1